MRLLAPAFLLLTGASQSSSENQLDWRWERDTPICSLIQAYSPDGKVIQISRTAGNDQTAIFLGNLETTLESTETLHRGNIVFVPDGKSEAELYVTKDKGGRTIFAQSDDTDFLSKFAKASAAEFIHKDLGTVKVPLRSARAAVEALRNCEDERMREWGIDPVAWRALRVRPLPVRPWTEWLSTDDYPVGAILAGLQGFVISRFQVGADGSVLDCKSITRSRSVHYRDRLCAKLKKRARFKPAQDANGQPLAAPYVIVIKFRLAER